MFHTFVIVCMFDMPVEFDNCISYSYSDVVRTEQECNEVIIDFITNDMEMALLMDDFYVYRVGCMNYLEDNTLTDTF